MHNSEQTQEPSEAQVLRDALQALCRNFPTDTDMFAAGWDSLEVETACSAYDKARAALDWNLRTPNKERAVTDNTAERPEHCIWKQRSLDCGDNTATWCGDCPKRAAAAIPITSKEQEKDHG